MNSSTDGILIIDKPEGKSSAFIDFVCRRITGAKKVGHIGTLDPFATGVLAVAINNGTKIIPYIKTESKVYEFEITFGKRMNTSDKTGKVVEISNKIPTLSEIKSILPKFIGKINQTPSIFSAIKVGNGKRAYEIAREGKTPTIPPRNVTIFNLELIGKNKFRAEVSPGTYIRSLTEDIAEALGTVAYTSALRRIKDGNFSIENSISLDVLEKNRNNLGDVLIPLENVLDDIPVILVSCQDAMDLSLGRCIKTHDERVCSGCIVKSPDGFIAVAEMARGIISPRRIIRNIEKEG